MALGADSINKPKSVYIPEIGSTFVFKKDTGGWKFPQTANTYEATEVAGSGAYNISQMEGEVKGDVSLTPSVQRALEKLNKVTTSYTMTLTFVDGSKYTCMSCRLKETASATGSQTLAWAVPSYHK